MTARRSFITTIALLCLLAWRGAVAGTSYDSRLQQADELRSSDPVEFGRLLQSLDHDAADATPLQRQQLQLLHAYREILTGDYKGSVSTLKSLLARTQDRNLRYRAEALLVNNYAVTREFSDGFAALDRMLALHEKVRDTDLRQRGLLTAAVFYNKAGQYDLGYHYAQMVLAEPVTPRSECFASSLQLESLQNQGKPTGSDASIQAIVRQCEATREGVASAFARSYLARKWHDEGRTADAIALLDRHMNEVRATRYPRLIGEIHELLAEYRLETGDLKRAQEHAQAAIDSSSGNTYSLPLVSAYRVLYEIDTRRHDTAAALEHYRSYAEVDKAYLNDIKARELAFQFTRHETLQKNQQIELLDRKNQVLQLQQRVDKQAAQNTQLFAALLVVLLATIGYWAYKTKRTQLSFRYLAETDTLTGISNRHHFTREAEEALAYCRRTGQDVGLIMFDIDEFKAINDRFGHAIGDEVLKLVASSCKDHCRKNDRVGRIGGEEFAMLLIGCSEQIAMGMAETCRVMVSQIDTRSSGHRIAVTASFGVAVASTSGYDLTHLMSHADQALYRSKHEGRNRVTAYARATTERPAPVGTQRIGT